jgi:cytoskeletal protein CcmA (bactofilin family)
MRHANGNADGNGNIHSDGDSDGHIHSDGDCDSNVYANSDGDINGYCFANGNCESDRTAAALTDATASADSAAACGQLLC